MVIVAYHDNFKRQVKKIKDNLLKERVKKQIKKIIEKPEIEKSMKNLRKGTWELYIPPFRLSYAYHKNENKVVLLTLYHKDEQ